ncbi:hypothetical protein QEW_4685 [Clostridioides difficile CD160]|nr:hypothetical protein QEW_4685 [Clostridioides difficile CD160]
MPQLLIYMIKLLSNDMLRKMKHANKEKIHFALLEVQDSIYLIDIEDMEEFYIPLKTNSLSPDECILAEFLYEKSIKMNFPVVYRCTNCNSIIFDKDKVYDGAFGYICETCNNMS